MTGELSRGFLRNKFIGTVWAVERDEQGTVSAVLEVAAALACPHQLAGYALASDVNVCAEINAALRQFEVFEPVCSEPAHLLADIAIAAMACTVAEGEWIIAHAHAKACKEVWEQKQGALRQVVHNSTTPPPPLPLFAEPAP